jgi:Staphylococcal nuclease homologue
VFQRDVEVHATKTDRYSRLVGKVIVDGRDACLEQLRAGLAWFYTHYQFELSLADRAKFCSLPRSECRPPRPLGRSLAHSALAVSAHCAQRWLDRSKNPSVDYVITNDGRHIMSDDSGSSAGLHYRIVSPCRFRAANARTAHICEARSSVFIVLPESRHLPARAHSTQTPDASGPALACSNRGAEQATSVTPEKDSFRHAAVDSYAWSYVSVAPSFMTRSGSWVERVGGRPR